MFPSSAADPSVTPTTQKHQRYNTRLAVEHCPAEPCTALQLLGHPISYGIIEDSPVAPETPRVPHNLPGQWWLQVPGEHLR